MQVGPHFGARVHDVFVFRDDANFPTRLLRIFVSLPRGPLLAILENRDALSLVCDALQIVLGLTGFHEMALALFTGILPVGLSWNAHDLEQIDRATSFRLDDIAFVVDRKAFLKPDSIVLPLVCDTTARHPELIATFWAWRDKGHSVGRHQSTTKIARGHLTILLQMIAALHA